MIKQRRGVLLLTTALTRLEAQRKAAGIAVERVLIELTESRPVEDMVALRRALEIIRGAGYQIVIDDVGPAVPKLDIPLAPNSLGAQVLMDASNRLSDLSGDLMSTIRTIANVPLLWRFVVYLATDPDTQRQLLDAGWKLLVVAAVGAVSVLVLVLFGVAVVSTAGASRRAARQTAGAHPRSSRWVAAAGVCRLVLKASTSSWSS